MALERDALTVFGGGADLAGGLILLVACLSGFLFSHPGRRKEKAVQSPEIAVDAKVLYVVLDTVDGRRLALLKPPPQFLAADFDEFAQPVIADGCQMGGCARSHASE